MELLKLFFICCGVWWADGAVVKDTPEGGFPAEAARLLQHIRMPRASLAAAVLKDLEDVLQPFFPGCNVELIGSIAMGLAIIESDVDVCITVRNQTDTTSAELVLKANEIMLLHPDLFQVTRTDTQRTEPVLTATHLPTRFSVDVTFNNYNGVMNSKLVHYLMSLDDRARDLAQILKHWARQHKVTGHTMLPSYGIVTMAIFFLQQKEILPTVASIQKNAEMFLVKGWNKGFTEEKYETTNEELLCALLGGFFKYYNEFNYKKYMASPFIGRPVEIELFKHLNTVPEHFELYKKNVGLNLERPLQLKIPIVQDSFQHNVNLACRIDIQPRSIFVTSIQHAARKYEQGCTGFLKAIL